MKNFKQDFPVMLVTASYILWLLAIAITPVGGWCESNPYHEHYKFAFVATTCMVFVSMVVLFITSKSKRHD